MVLKNSPVLLKEIWSKIIKNQSCSRFPEKAIQLVSNNLRSLGGGGSITKYFFLNFGFFDPPTPQIWSGKNIWSTIKKEEK